MWQLTCKYPVGAPRKAQCRERIVAVLYPMQCYNGSNAEAREQQEQTTHLRSAAAIFIVLGQKPGHRESCWATKRTDDAN
jgi:hypothetical protein